MTIDTGYATTMLVDLSFPYRYVDDRFRLQERRQRSIGNSFRLVFETYITKIQIQNAFSRILKFQNTNQGDSDFDSNPYLYLSRQGELTIFSGANLLEL